MPWGDRLEEGPPGVGSILTDAALGFSKALLEIPKERLARQKDELELDRLKSQIAYDKARAASEERRYQGDRYLKTGWEVYDLHDIDPVTNKPRVLSTKPPAAGRPDSTLEMRRKHVIESYEQVFGVPFQDWARAGVFSHPRYGEFTDAFAGRGDIRIGPDGAIVYMPHARAAAQGQPTPGTPRPGDAKPVAGEKPVTDKPTDPTKPATGSRAEAARWDYLLALLDETADHEGVPRDLARAVVKQESNWDINAEGDGKQAKGWFQLHEGAAKDAGIDPARRHEPELNIRGGLRYLALKYKQAGGDWDKALQLYNGGGDPNYVANVRRHMQATPQAATGAATVPAKPAEKPLPGTPTTPLAPIPSTVEWQLEQWQQKPPEVADQEIATWLKAPAAGISVPDLLSRVEAYRKLRGTDPPGWSEHPVAKRIAAGQGQPAQPTQPTGPSTPGAPSTSPPGQPPAPQAQPSAAPTATGQPGPGQIPVQQVRTPAQIQKDEADAAARGRAGSEEERKQDEHAWKYWQAQLNWSAEQRAEWYQQRLARLDKTQHPTVEQAAVANDLWTSGQVRPETMGFYPDLDPYEKKKVNDVIKDPVLKEEARKQGDFMRRQSAENRADRREHLEAMGKVQPFFQEIGALDTAQYLTTQIIDLIEKGNVGLWGKVSGYEQAIGNIVGYRQNQFLTQIDAQLKAAGINPNIDTTARKLALTNAIETTDPKIRQQYRMISPQSRVQTLSSLLIYAHAMAAKRVAGGTERGLIGTDMAHAEKLFDPSLWYANPGQLLANLQELQGFIHQARPKLDEMITAHHINPKTKLLIKRDYEDKPGAVPATQVPAAPQVAPQVEQHNMQILQGG